MGKGIVREFEMDMDTLLCLTWRTSRDLDSTGSSAQYLILTHNGKEYEKKKMHICTFV